MAVDLLELGADAAAALEEMGYVAVARRRDGVVTVELRKLVGTRQYVMSHVLDDASVPVPELAARCDAEFRAALSHHE
jgi:enhancing lycopene biosynthesis protein 2